MSEGGESALTRLWRRWPGTVLRLALAALPLVWLRRMIDPGALADRLRLVGAAAWLAAFGLVIVTSAVGALRWYTLLRAYGAERPPGPLALLRENVVAAYFALLPSGLAGDAIRGYRLRRHLDGFAVSYTVIVVDRLCGLVGLLLIAQIAVAAGPVVVRSAALAAFDVGAIGVLVVAAIALGLPSAMARSERLRAVVPRLPIIGPRLAQIPAPRSLAGLVPAVLLSLGTQGCAISAVAVIVKALAPSLTISACLRLLPPIVLLGYVPIAPAGLGQREALFTYFLGLAGVPPEAAVAASLTFLSCLAAQAALGGAIWFVEQRRRIASPEA